ncbi:MAG TPA: hemolysin III family protein [Candidatus Solibacter sp.]|nr:hemolysin III family protein [Candidatus Solibacter sp.]
MLQLSRAQRHELANSLTHGAGLALAVAGCAVLVTLAALRGNARHIVACSVYGATLVCLYAASTVYHSVRSRRLRRVMRFLDHSAIYLLIAGTYTPFMLVNLRGGWGWTLFGLVWGMAAAGIVLKVWYVGKFPIASTIVYVAMGWVAIVAVKPILAMVPVAGILWLLAGGLLYTAGVGFFAWEKLPYHHAIWHLFVIGGSVCHYIAVVRVVVPGRLA